MRDPSLRRLVLLLLLVGGALLACPRASLGQAVNDPRPRLQAGLGLLPGLGAQFAYVEPRNLYTREVALFVDVSPGLGGGEGSVQVSGALGGALRVFNIGRLFGRAPVETDLDVGARLGPGLFFALNDVSKETKNQQFSIFFEPFVRFTSTFGTGTVFFLEAGSQRPLVRGGFWFPLGAR